MGEKFNRYFRLKVIKVSQIYGAGSTALSLTVEYGGEKNNLTQAAQIDENQKFLCREIGKIEKFHGCHFKLLERKFYAL